MTNIQAIKQVASLHRTMLHAYLDLINSVDPRRTFRVCTPTPGDACIVLEPIDEEQGLLPDSTELSIAWGKWNECDYAVQTFIESLQLQLCKQVPGTLVHWLNVDVVPQFVFKSPVKDMYFEPQHSAFLIELPEHGAEFVADFTLEQFGFPGESWFSPTETYRTMMKSGSKWHLLDVNQRREDLEGTFDSNSLRIQTMLCKFCRDLNWDAVLRMSASDGEAYVYEMTQKALTKRPEKRAYC